MNKVIIFGNSGSGKSTYAKHLKQTFKLEHLDLDTIAWQPYDETSTLPPQRMAIAKSESIIHKFISENNRWVIEGCYADLLQLVSPLATNMIFMNLPISKCINNAINRPFEPHKYKSKEAQDANLAMLVEWIRNYENRDDTFSLSAHKALFEAFGGNKVVLTTNQELI